MGVQLRKQLYFCEYCKLHLELNSPQALGGHKVHCIRNPNKHAGRASTEEKEQVRREKISATMKKNPNAGGRRNGSGRGKKCWYDSHVAGKVFLDSSYELAYARWLDENDIKWERNWTKFPYDWEGKIRYYIPDFYLTDEQRYIEIKGYETDKDRAKWKSFPYKLEVLKEVDLKRKGILK